MPKDAFDKMKVAELREKLEAAGLDTSGTKPVLLKRLRAAPAKKEPEPEPEPVLAAATSDPSSAASDPGLDPSSMKVADLKKELAARGLEATGKRAQLAARLAEALSGGGTVMEEEQEEEAPPPAKAAPKAKAKAAAPKAKPAASEKRGLEEISDAKGGGGGAKITSWKDVEQPAKRAKGPLSKFRQEAYAPHVSHTQYCQQFMEIHGNRYGQTRT